LLTTSSRRAETSSRLGVELRPADFEPSGRSSELPGPADTGALVTVRSLRPVRVRKTLFFFRKPGLATRRPETLPVG
jgi:hypothetical protein